MRRYRIIYNAKYDMYYPQYSWSWGLIWHSWVREIFPSELYEYRSYETYAEAADFLRRHLIEKIKEKEVKRRGNVVVSEFTEKEFLSFIGGDRKEIKE